MGNIKYLGVLCLTECKEHPYESLLVNENCQIRPNFNRLELARIPKFALSHFFFQVLSPLIILSEIKFLKLFH